MRLLPACFALAFTIGSTAFGGVAYADPPAATAEPATSSEEAPPQDYPPPSTRWKMAGVGLASAAVFYGAGAGLSYAYPDVPGMKDLRVPVVGPWIGIANNGCPPTDGDCSTALVVVRSILMALDGLAQAGSIGVAIEGLFMPTQEVSASGTPETPRAPSSPAPKPNPNGNDKNLFFLPKPMTVGARGIGLGVVGTF